jgi:prepilin-type N-terminal cleavage/methylation domain-containing protein
MFFGNTADNKALCPGFTLVEILVVIAIVCLLVALIFPAIVGAMDRARQVQCTNNLHQFGLAYILYTNDYGGWFPVGTAIGNTSHGWIYSSWVKYDGTDTCNVISGGATPAQIRQGVLWPYLEDYEIYKCPGDKNRKIRNFSYSQNVAYVERNLSQISPYLAKVILMVEEQRPDDGAFWYQNSGAANSRDCLAFDRHCRCTCLLFGDGHIQGVPYVNIDSIGKLQDIGSFPGEEDRW